MQAGSTLSAEQQIGNVDIAHLDTLAQHIKILQQIQCLFNCAGLSEATLVDLASLIVGLQREYGVTTSLEDVIQALVGQHLLLQYQLRRQHEKRLAA
jgi:hypothetical protein